MEKIIIVQTVLPDYRKNFFNFLKKNLNDKFELFGGETYFDQSIKTDSSIFFFTRLRNYFFFNRTLLFQTGMWNIIFKKNNLVLELNPRIISNWIILFLRFRRSNKTILWGHAWPRKGPNAKSDRLRNIMRNLADEIIVYTRTQKVDLQVKMPSKKISAAPNSIYLKDQMVSNLDINLIKNIIYVGRLTKSKKPMLLVESFHLALINLPDDANLLIIGEGSEKKEIEIYLKNNHLENRIKLLGHIDRYEELKQLYGTSVASVSPGYAGLSVTLSLGFGVPLIISKNEDHSPELEAVRINENSQYFITDSASSLSQMIINFYQEKELWTNKRVEICNYCKENYSIEMMAESFLN